MKIHQHSKIPTFNSKFLRCHGLLISTLTTESAASGGSERRDLSVELCDWPAHDQQPRTVTFSFAPQMPIRGAHGSRFCSLLTYNSSCYVCKFQQFTEYGLSPAPGASGGRQLPLAGFQRQPGRAEGAHASACRRIGCCPPPRAASGSAPGCCRGACPRGEWLVGRCSDVHRT